MREVYLSFGGNENCQEVKENTKGGLRKKKRREMVDTTNLTSKKTSNTQKKKGQNRKRIKNTQSMGGSFGSARPCEKRWRNLY